MLLFLNISVKYAKVTLQFKNSYIGEEIDLSKKLIYAYLLRFKKETSLGAYCYYYWSISITHTCVVLMFNAIMIVIFSFIKRSVKFTFYIILLV